MRHPTRIIAAVGAALIAAITMSGSPAQAADTVVYTHHVSGFDANGNPESDTFSLSVPLTEATVSVPAGSGLTTTTAGECRRITASSKYVAPVGTLWTFTSGAVYCFKRNVRITYFAWETPDGHVTKAGQLAGWKYTGFDHSKHAIDSCRTSGESVGHFKQSYPFGVGTLAKQDAVQDVIVSCTGSHPQWS